MMGIECLIYIVIVVTDGSEMFFEVAFPSICSVGCTLYILTGLKSEGAVSWINWIKRVLKVPPDEVIRGDITKDLL